jgi:hypothetical protein
VARFCQRTLDSAHFAVLLVVVALVAVGRAVTYAPSLDPDCWASCSGNAFLLVSSSAAANALRVVELALTAAIGIALAAFAMAGIRRAGAPRWTWDGWVLLPAAAVGLAATASAAALLVRPAERPMEPVFVVLFLANAVTVAALGFGVSSLVAGSVARAAAVRRLAADIGAAEAPDALRTALVRRWATRA